MTRRIIVTLLGLLLSSCGGASQDGLPDAGTDAGPDAGEETGDDAGSGDGGSDGGVDGGEPDGGPVDGGTEPAACDDRTGGALITFDVGIGDGPSERLTVWITHDAFIEEALAQLDGERPRVPNFLDLHEGRDCDPVWTWHPDPEQVTWADFTFEICDGLPSWIEADRAFWFEDVDQFCPWDARVRAVDDRR